MKSLILLLILLSISITPIYTKCGLNRLYCHGEQYTRSCNDIELYEQCKNAENLLNIYTKLVFDQYNNTNLFSKYDLQCDKNIMCECDLLPNHNDRDRTLYCESIALYNSCNEAILYLNNYDITIDDQNITLPNHIKIQRPFIRCNKINNNSLVCNFDGVINSSHRINIYYELSILFVLIFLFIFY